MAYGDKRDYRKIEIFVKRAGKSEFEYFASTTWSPTCKDAVARAMPIIKKSYRVTPEVRANFKQEG
jgi:hypothetical protein